MHPRVFLVGRFCCCCCCCCCCCVCVWCCCFHLLLLPLARYHYLWHCTAHSNVPVWIAIPPCPAVGGATQASASFPPPVFGSSEDDLCKSSLPHHVVAAQVIHSVHAFFSSPLADHVLCRVLKTNSFLWCVSYFCGACTGNKSCDAVIALCVRTVFNHTSSPRVPAGVFYYCRCIVQESQVTPLFAVCMSRIDLSSFRNFPFLVLVSYLSTYCKPRTCLRSEFVVIAFGLFFVFSEKQPPGKKMRNFKKTVVKPASIVTRRFSSVSSAGTSSQVGDDRFCAVFFRVSYPDSDNGSVVARLLGSSPREGCPWWFNNVSRFFSFRFVSFRQQQDVVVDASDEDLPVEWVKRQRKNGTFYYCNTMTGAIRDNSPNEGDAVVATGAPVTAPRQRRGVTRMFKVSRKGENVKDRKYHTPGHAFLCLIFDREFFLPLA